MEEIRRGFWASLIALIMGTILSLADHATSHGPTPDYAVRIAPRLAADILSGDTGSLTLNVEAAYRAAGASLNDTLVWRVQDYDQIFNWYDQYAQVITLSAMPQDGQVAPYWDNWAAALTGARWDWRRFFADADEARDMARFNQFVLAAHEYGHALSYRYDPEHVRRENGEVNCRELAADRLAGALLEDLADADPRFAHWRQRYAELIASINEEIDPAQRYTLADFAGLDADCHIIHVEQPELDTMTPYASAFFARWQVMLKADLPALPALYQTRLFAPWLDGLTPGAPLARGIRTVGRIDADYSGRFEHGKAEGWHDLAFAPGGDLYVLDYAAWGAPDRLGLYLAYGPAGVAKRKPALESDDLGITHVDGDSFDIGAFLPLGPDRFVVASVDMFDLSGPPVLLDLQRGPDGWTSRILQPLPDSRQIDTRLRLTGPDMASFEIYEIGGAGEDDMPDHWVRYPLDLTTFTLGRPDRWPETRYEWFNDLPDGRSILLDGNEPMVLLADAESLVRIAGNGLQGLKDAPNVLDAEFVHPLTAIGAGDDTVRVLDVDPTGHYYVIRDITLVP